jgi:hypothetical protein
MATTNSGYQSPEEMYQMIEQLKNELKLEKVVVKKRFELKVSPKGCCSVYIGKNRFPTSHYMSDWKFILSKKEEILQFLDDNADKLASKETDGSNESS